MKLFKNFLFRLAILVCALVSIRTSGTDKTLEDKAVGQDVVQAVVDLILKSKIFTNDFRFLLRTAYVESEFGNDPNTFEPRNGVDYHGGIWQVDQSTFLDTQNTNSNPSLSALLTQIKENFAIEWTSMTWVNCRKPLISALAARLALTISHKAIPDTLQAQGQYWFENYNSASETGSAQHFVDRAKVMEKMNKCRGRMDLVIVMDGSGSIGTADFGYASQFVSEFIQTFSPENVNLGYIVFSSTSKVIFPLDSHLSVEEMKELVLNDNYIGGSTNTSGALLTAVDLFQKADHREGSPRIMLVFTDGYSDYPGVAKGAAAAKANSISTFAVGIGSYTNAIELLEIALNDSTHVLPISSYEDLSDSFEMMNTQTCKIPQRPDVGQEVADSLEKDEKRYYCYEITSDGITVIIEIIKGGLKSYYSYSIENPSSALNDGTINGRKFIPSLKTYNGKHISNKVCVTIEGNQKYNNYTIETDKGNTEGNTESCQCTGVLGNHCGHRAKYNCYLRGNCDENALYFCSKPNEEATKIKTCRSQCNEKLFGNDFCDPVLRRKLKQH